MNAVNLLTMMFAAQEAAASKPQQGSNLPAEVGFFWQFQQQALANDGPLFSSGRAQGSALPAEILALLPAAMVGNQVEPAPDASALVSDAANVAGQAWTLSDLLNALVGSLRRILQAGALRPTAQPSPVDSGSPSPLLDETISPSAVDGRTVAAGDAEQARSALIAAWNRVIALLNSRLASQFPGAMKASATPLHVVQPELARPAVPWTVVLNAPTSIDQSAAATLTAEPLGYPLTVDQDLLAELPASVRWFSSLGLIGSPRIAQHGSAAPVPLSTSLELPDGTQAVVRLSQLAIPGQSGQQQSYAISIELPGEGATVLTATLTIQRLAPLPSISVADPNPVLAGLRPITVADIAQTGGLLTGGPEAEMLVPRPAEAQASLTGTAIESQPLPAGQPAELSAPAEDGYLVTEELMPGLKSVPALKASVPAVQAEQQARHSANQPNRTSWTVQMALDQLNGAQQKPTIVQLKQSGTGRVAQMPLAAGEQLGAELAPAVAAPIGADLATPQLMEFVGSRIETAQYAGLQYLEMAERIMERVATARSAGNGLYNAHLDLNPPNLGKMFVNISVRGDAVALQIAVASTVPREQLKDSLEALRRSLEDEGLYVVELQVHEVDGDEHGSNGQQQSGSERDDSGSQSGEPAVKTTPSLIGVRKSTPALGFDN